ncbi:transmembrane protein, putative (macronuclear) [Tetrahymena thermophila SB210]|uniref:Transmembrane protein, putative n=1 Tax=Tetrahymena thermophila (strain SB210) TaxID=312017 RepID=W7XKF6_TETTS|nr:transmembrane protein, putative [Tetrahymena thermophila SB210]EWS76491.1 transmembrane protein, putative [Tetrahymena thermophila SB210]|eukprot:XP_012650974.1 transmembrane protein, putative [Tetrahymena thermophila SB210]
MKKQIRIQQMNTLNYNRFIYKIKRQILRTSQSQHLIDSMKIEIKQIHLSILKTKNQYLINSIGQALLKTENVQQAKIGLKQLAIVLLSLILTLPNQMILITLKSPVVKILMFTIQINKIQDLQTQSL